MIIDRVVVLLEKQLAINERILKKVEELENVVDVLKERISYIESRIVINKTIKS